MHAALAALAVALAATSGAASAAPDGDEWLVYAQERPAMHRYDFAPDRWLCAAGGGEQTGRRLTPRSGRVSDPDVSPRGEEVVYSDANFDIRRQPLADGPSVELAPGGSSPAWSADGARVYFTDPNADFSDSNIAVVSREGGPATQIVATDAVERYPAPSPDGRHLAYVRAATHTTPGQLWLAKPDGSDRRRLVARVGVTSADWSPDGARLVFAANGALWTVSVDGTDERGPLGTGSAPAWSPDGTRIAFAFGADIWIIPAAGGTRLNATRSPIEESEPTWAAAPSAPRPSDFCALVGTAADDVLTGGPGDDMVYDIGGDDVIRTLGGNDFVVDGGGRDAISTGEGNDTIRFFAGRNAIRSGDGDDSIAAGIGGVAAQAIDGGAGNDTLSGGAGSDRIAGGEGRDLISGQLGADVLLGGPGDDRLAGGFQRDVLVGGPGRDGLHGERGDDLLLARDGERDRVLGGPGRDRASVDAHDRAVGVELLGR
jgi:Ca2+-binding RTX toxin-like protein